MKEIPTVLFCLSALVAASADAPLKVVQVQLPFAPDADELVIRTDREWQSFVSQRSTGAPAPCAWATRMLVAARPADGTSGCAEPPSGIRVEVVEGRYVVSAWIAMAEGDCHAYFRPMAAACVPQSATPPLFKSEHMILVAP